MDKSYTVACGHAPFYWGLWLDRAIETLPDQEELVMAANKAKDWPTCAVGNACAIIPRGRNGAPEDEKLHVLGNRFFGRLHFASVPFTPDDVRRGHLMQARGILQKIEARAMVVIEETLKALNTK